MATEKEVEKALATKEVKTLQGMIRDSARELGNALPSHLSPQRIVRIALTCIRLNPELEKCTPESFLGSLFVLAQLGLEPIAGRAYLLPFKNKRKIGGEWKTVSEVQALIGYKGLADLFYRHESAVSLNWGIVRENDDFSYEYGTKAYLRHIEGSGERGKVKGYYVIAQLKSGGTVFKYMSYEDCIAHGKKHSKTWLTKEWKNGSMVDCVPHWAPSSPWLTSEDSMCLKTVLIQLAKLLPLSVELQKALEVDETSRDFRRGISDLTDVKSNTDWTKEEPIEAETSRTEEVQPAAEEQPPKKDPPIWLCADCGFADDKERMENGKATCKQCKGHNVHKVK